MGLFKERKRKFLLLSLISAVVVVSTAFVGFPIYAQSDDSNLTTFEEEAMKTGDTMDPNNSTSASTDNAAEHSSTSVSDVSSLFNGLVICNVGTSEISNETQIGAALDEASRTTPTVSVQEMTESQVADLASNETGTASASSETSSAADCILAGGDNSTSTASSNATSLGTSNETSVSGAPGPNDKILVIEGQDFVPGQVVLIFSENALIGIDDVDSDGNIEAKIPVPSGGETAAGTDTSSNNIKLRFVESGTQRSATFEFDGQTLTAAEGSDIKAEDNNEATTPAAAPSDNGTSTTNGTSTMNNTSNNSITTTQ